MDGSRPFSSISFFTAGDKASLPLSDAAAGAGAGAGSGSAFGAGSTLASSFATAGFALTTAPSPSPIMPSNASTSTVSPVSTVISARTPAAGDGSSIVTLSVSSSTRGSSTATASPACLNHWITSASVTDSPSVGTRISVLIISCRFLSVSRRSMLQKEAGSVLEGVCS